MGAQLTKQEIKELKGMATDLPMSDERAKSAIAFIREVVAYSYDLKPSQIEVRSRSGSKAVARQVVAYLARKICQSSYPEIGRHLKCHQSAVKYAQEAIQDRVDTQPKFKEQIQWLTTFIDRKLKKDNQTCPNAS